MDVDLIAKITIGTLAILVPTGATLYLAFKKKRPGDILVVDDDLGNDQTFLDILATHFKKYRICAFTDPDEAKQYMYTNNRIILCLVDLVFRSGSTLTGVAFAEFCLSQRVKVIIITGHNIEDLGIEVKELEKLGIRKSKIMRKPATMKGYDAFLNKLEKTLPSDG